MPGKEQFEAIATAYKQSGKTSKKPTPAYIAKQPGPEAIICFYILFFSHLLAALFSPIQDCDEVYNYWEPTHYLNHEYGMETWEYSPDYAIRSWVYSGIHAAIIKVGRILPIVSKSNKHAEFYFLRIMLGFICAVCEARLYSHIRKQLNGRIAVVFLIVMATSPGMFHASVAYLPSSFAMYGFMLSLAAFMDWRGGMRTAQGMMWVGLGSCVGWPFAFALLIPFLAEEGFFLLITREWVEPSLRLLDGIARILIIGVLQFLIDSWFYKKLVCVPWNIVRYNVFGGSERGPDIYGTEPWHFYVRNLLLNFNIWFLLALVSMPLLFFTHFMRRQHVTRKTPLRDAIFITPFYMWLAIFTLQPHKEERFMYPIYPAIALNAAYSTHILLSVYGTRHPRSLLNLIPYKIRMAFASFVVFLALNVGVLRALSLITAYSAPLSIYKPLREPGMAHPGATVCLGKEWYRFPSSYHLPNGMRAKFVKSAFSGLLPGEFSEAGVGFGWYPGAWLVPSGMNDQNVEDPGKHTDIELCSYMVDSYFPGSEPAPLEPDYILDTDTWERVTCAPFLDVGNTSTIGRLLWVPDWAGIPDKHRRKWGEYCLLRRKE